MKYSLLLMVLLFSAQAHAFEMVDGALIDVNSDQEQIMGTAMEMEMVPLASDSDQVPANLKILGKGILNAEQNTSLAVACVGLPETEGAEPTCDQLRVVEFDANRIPHWEGAGFEIKSTRSFQVALKREYRKKFRIHFLKVKKDAGRTHRVGKTIALATIIGGAVFNNYINAVIIPALGGAFVGYLVLMSPWLVLGVMAVCHVDVLAGPVNLVLAPFRGLGNAMVMDGSTSMTAASGWNWAEKPTEVSNKKYSKIKALLADFANGGVQMQ